MEPLTALVLRARLVRPGWLFFAREALRRRGTHSYTLRESGLQVVVRQRTGDVVTLSQIFHDPDHRPPPEVQAVLDPVERVLDLGANIGLFGVLAAGLWPDAHITSFEPDPANAEIHEQTIRLNRLESRWRLVRAAAGAHPGRASFEPGEFALSHLSESDGGPEAIEVEVLDVLPQICEADLVKLDIEGGEWALLSDPRFRESPPKALVFEYHPRFCPGPAPREQAESLLAAAGLQMRSIWHRDVGHGMFWAWRS